MNEALAQEKDRLGALVKSYKSNRESMILLYLGAAVCAVGGVVTLAAGLGQRLARDKVLLSAAGLMVLMVCLGLFVIARRAARARADVFEFGIAVTDKRGQQAVCLWDDVVEVYELLIYRDPSRGTSGTIGGKYSLVCADGRQIKFGVNLQDSKALGLTVQSQVKARLLPLALAAYQSGADVSFGPKLALNKQGITCRGQTLSWQEVGDLSLRSGVQIRRVGKPGYWQSIGHAEIANYPVLRELVGKIRS